MVERDPEQLIYVIDDDEAVRDSMGMLLESADLPYRCFPSADSFIAEGKQALVLRERLGEIPVPILVIWGDKDRVLPRSHAEALPGGCEVEILSDCGHMVQMEASAEVNRLIARFLQKSD